MRRLGLLAIACVLALAAWPQEGHGRRAQRAWVPHRADATLRTGTILRGYDAQAHLLVATAPPRGQAPGRLQAALAVAGQLEERPRDLALMKQLVSLALFAFPRGTEAGERAYLERVGRVARHGRAISLARLAAEDLASCRERAVALKLLLEQAGMREARLRMGSLYRRTPAGPVYVSGHAWVELPQAEGEVWVLDPSAGAADAISHARPARRSMDWDGVRGRWSFVAVGERYLVHDHALERRAARRR